MKQYQFYPCDFDKWLIHLVREILSSSCLSGAQIFGKNSIYHVTKRGRHLTKDRPNLLDTLFYMRFRPVWSETNFCLLDID